MDFSFTKPYQYFNQISEDYKYETIVFEVDGPHHLLQEQVIYDKLRDKKISEKNGNVIRFSSFEIQNLTKTPEEYLQQDNLRPVGFSFQKGSPPSLNIPVIFLTEPRYFFYENG